VRRDDGYRFGPRYHALLDLWKPLCGTKSKNPLGVATYDFDGTAEKLEKRATKRGLAVCAKCVDMLERGITPGLSEISKR